MNKERLLKLADVIEAKPDNFDMGRWFQTIGITTATEFVSIDQVTSCLQPE